MEPRRRARDLILGLISDLPDKNCWTISEHIGDASPDGLQHLLAKSVWDHDGVRDDRRDYVVEHLGTDEAILVVDETGDLKKGSHKVGTRRQYSGTAGRIENCQVAVYLTCTTDTGHALIDRELSLPKSWADDLERRAEAGAPDDVEFATKPALAKQMVLRALDATVGSRWVAGDEVYSGDPGLRGALEGRGAGYVPAVACSHQIPTAAGKRRADQIASSLPARAWQRLSAGIGSKGPRWYDWVSWQRWTVLSMFAYAFLAVLAVLAVTERAANPAPAGLIALTCNEIHHLFNHLIAQPIRDTWYRIRWSTWRRQHQHRARTCHCQRRTPTAEP
ncbi:hypothetical protein Nocox_24600 [Nonomuraea coxensis DSM 45129]|uniref:Transposase IS701-like DDE domain-containing protein n=1 Tax=Nonomuraea coxensis DSM 45129 TaxID=1122611 RepID=A0ABX8U765_9ACTN|nr:IS701 family transposase [Nonomuraea coxensis]QYC42523.1 hypothetical protein Nocox_24600 [Nonomuraea coxensis DSM 45129]